MDKKAYGFTIVELLVVIVVIAILAAVSIVAYNGIQKRARESRIMTQLVSLRKQMEVDKVLNGKWAFEDSIRACIANAPGGWAGYEQCGTTTSGSLNGNTSAINEVITYHVQRYITQNLANSGSSGSGFYGWFARPPLGISATGAIQFCIGVPVVMDAAVSSTEAFYISSEKLGVSPKGSNTWCTS